MYSSSAALAAPSLGAAYASTPSQEVTSTATPLEALPLPINLSYDSLARPSSTAMLMHGPICPCGGCGTVRSALFSGTTSGSNQAIVALSENARPSQTQQLIGLSVISGAFVSLGIVGHSARQHRLARKQPKVEPAKPHRA